jgi:hypothetical protein
VSAPDAKLPVGFAPRAEALAPSGVYAQGAVAVRLALQLAAAPIEQLRELRAAVVAVGAAGAPVERQRALIVLGPADWLPWVDGVIFVGACAQAPELLLPSYCEPDVHVDLVLRAVAPGERRGQYLLLPHTRSVIAIGHAARVDAAALRAWAASEPRREPEPAP